MTLFYDLLMIFYDFLWFLMIFVCFPLFYVSMIFVWFNDFFLISYGSFCFNDLFNDVSWCDDMFLMFLMIVCVFG